jgi:tetratricopeptide (TPR) repeat protein
MSSSSSVAAPAVVDKHAELLKMVNKCTHYKCTSRRKARHVNERKSFFFFFFSLFCLSSSSHNTVVRTFCAHCYMTLIDASPKTADCRLGELCGCGARYCGIKCLVASSQAHKDVCAQIQIGLMLLAKSRFRATEKLNQAALKWGSHLQVDLLCADIVNAILDAAKILHIAEAFELAQKFAQRALSLAVKGSLSESAALNMLGMVAATVCKFDAALAHYEATLKIRKTLLDDNHTDVAGVSVNLSAVFQHLGQLDEALAMCSSALEIYRKAPGDNQKSIAICHNSIGDFLRQQGKSGEAMEHFSTGLAITLKTEGETALAADFLANIGLVLEDQNELDEAMVKHVSALRIFERAKVDTSVATCHLNIGRVLSNQGKLDAALEHARKSLAIRQSKLTPENVECGESHWLIGNILFHSEKFAEALDEFDNALRIRKNVHGEMTLNVADVYQSKAACFFNLRKWREAVTFYEATIHIRTVLGADDADFVNAKARLAAVEELIMAERWSAAERK